MSKFFEKFSFWTKLKLFLGSIGIGSEVALYIVDSNPVFKYVIGGATVIALAITHFVQDKNNNNIVDNFE